jgi:hypothetical protein
MRGDAFSGIARGGGFVHRGHLVDRRAGISGQVDIGTFKPIARPNRNPSNLCRPDSYLVGGVVAASCGFDTSYASFVPRPMNP